jgi:hypothetical protein
MVRESRAVTAFSIALCYGKSIPKPKNVKSISTPLQAWSSIDYEWGSSCCAGSYSHPRLHRRGTLAGLNHGLSESELAQCAHIKLLTTIGLDEVVRRPMQYSQEEGAGRGRLLATKKIEHVFLFGTGYLDEVFPR